MKNIGEGYIINMKSFKDKCSDQIRGSLIGGAAGDALGYTVEFLSLEDIKNRYSNKGITKYSIDSAEGNASISDDTQMSLFTADGILKSGILKETINCKLNNNTNSTGKYVYTAYLNWLITQTGETYNQNGSSRLLEIGELHVRRAPGITCLAALGSGIMGSIETPINDSKGGGGVMRVAPIALYFRYPNPCDGAIAAAITHGHPLGYMPAAALVQIINRIIYGGCVLGDTLYEIIDECGSVLKELFSGEEYLDELLNIINLSVSLSKNNDFDTENIARIGEGWVAEEALAIGIYCSLKYYDDFSAGLIAAVNHDGDSDSTGSITGNIIGAHIGYNNIPQEWKTNLQLHDEILKIADELYCGQ